MLKLKTILLVSLLLVFCIGVGAGIFAYTQFQPVSSVMQRTSFQVPKGESVNQIAGHLQSEGFIKQALAFRAVVWKLGLGSKIQAGTYTLSPSMSLSEIAVTMTTSTNEVWVRIQEGWRTEEIADMLAQQNLANFDKQQFLSLAKGNEGHLFPDSYQIQKDSTAETIYTLLTSTFDKKVTHGLSAQLAQSSRSLNDILTMASIVQREARSPDAKMIAGILWKRVDLHAAINADATLQYMKGYDPVAKTWWPEPLNDDKLVVSPYNTYKNPGLPPGPIDNPGLNAIQAALDPTPSQYYYYIHDRQGNVHFAVTLEEQNANVQQYLR